HPDFHPTPETGTLRPELTSRRDAGARVGLVSAEPGRIVPLVPACAGAEPSAPARRMSMVKRFCVVGVALFALAAVALGEGQPRAASHPTLEKLKKLAGTWVEADKDGKPTDKVVSVVKVTAGGSAVVETLFPGQAHEMVSVYHLDGKDVVMTHYCVLGNQPRMKADPKSPEGKIHWQFTGGTNLDVAKDKHMHEATVTFVDDDHLEIAGVA